MKRQPVRIGELRLRAPGVSAATARQLAEAVAARLRGASGSIGALHVRVPGTSADVAQLADKIAASVRGGRR